LFGLSSRDRDAVGWLNLVAAGPLRKSEALDNI